MAFMSFNRRNRSRTTAMLVLASIGAAAALSASLTGCGSAPGPTYDTYLAAADTAVHRTIVPRYERYVQQDPGLNLEQKTSLLDEAAAFTSVTESAIRERAGP